MAKRACLAGIACVIATVASPTVAIPHEGEAAEAISEAAFQELVSLMLHDFATALDNAEATIVDRRVRVQLSNEEGIWFYSQLNTGADLSLYRQRFHQITLSDDGRSVIQRSYSPADPEKFANGWADPDVFAGLSKTDLKPALESDCAQHWHRREDGVWHGSVDPERCAIFSARRQVTIRIGADAFYSGETYGKSERGFDEDMNPIWGSKVGEYISLTRCRSEHCSHEAKRLAERGD